MKGNQVDGPQLESILKTPNKSEENNDEKPDDNDSVDTVFHGVFESVTEKSNHSEISQNSVSNSPKNSPPPLVGFNTNIDTRKKQKTVECEVCKSKLNAKSLAKHMREVHDLSGPGRSRVWSRADDGAWRRNSEIDKRKAEGNLSSPEGSNDDTKKAATTSSNDDQQ